MAGRSSSGSSTALISPTMGSSSARSCPGSAGLAFTEGSGHAARILPRPGCYTRPMPRLPLEIEDIKAILPHRYPVPARGPDHRAGGGPPHRRGEERRLRRALLHRRARAAVPCCPRPSSPRPWPRPGAVLILSKPENRSRLIYFMGIDKVRYRRPVAAGDTVLLEGTVVRLRGQDGQPAGRRARGRAGGVRRADDLRARRPAATPPLAAR